MKDVIKVQSRKPFPQGHTALIRWSRNSHPGCGWPSQSSYVLPCAAERSSSPGPSREVKNKLNPGTFTLPSAEWVELLSGAGNRVRFPPELGPGSRYPFWSKACCSLPPGNGRRDFMTQLGVRASITLGRQKDRGRQAPEGWPQKQRPHAPFLLEEVGEAKNTCPRCQLGLQNIP